MDSNKIHYIRHNIAKMDQQQARPDTHLTNTDVLKQKMDALIAGRPRAYRSLIFQRILVWLFLLKGVLLFLAGLYIIMVSAFKETAMLYLKENMSDVIGFYIPPDFADHILTYFIPLFRNIQIALGVSVIGLSVLCLIIARYCQKTINRNKYIMRIESAWAELKSSLS